MNQALPISALITVTTSISATAAQAQNTSTLLILGSSGIIDTVQRMRSYASLTAVATDFGTSAPEYSAAQLWFGQSPQPTLLYIGEWAQAATPGKLICAPLTTAQQAIANFTAITAGSFDVTIDGVLVALTGLNFSAAANLNAVAAIIQTALTTASAPATFIWNGNQFVLTTTTTGAAATVTFLTAGATGTNISALLGGAYVAGNGAYIANGIIAETALAAATLFDNQFGQQWYAMEICGAADSDHTAVGAFLSSTANKHFYGATTNEAGVLVSTDTADVAYLMSQANLAKAAVQYSSTSSYAIGSLLAKILSTNPSGNNTAIQLMYQGEPLITAETLSTTQAAAVAAKNCNVFAAYNNATAIIQYGVCCNGSFIDTTIYADVLSVAVETAVYNLLYTNGTKIPQTDAGMHQIVAVIQTVMQQFVQNGFLAPGTWTGTGFGSLATGGYLDAGFYIYAPPVSTQLAAPRAARMAVPIQIAAKLAGAVSTVAVAITLNP